MTLIDDLMARIDALEGRSITVADLPVAALQRRLEQRWQPDATTLLLPSSVTREALAQKFDYGVATVTWPGGVEESDIATVNHSLGVTPRGVIPGSSFGLWSAGVTGTYTAGTFQLAVRTLDGTLPLAAATQTINWIAFA